MTDSHKFHGLFCVFTDSTVHMRARTTKRQPALLHRITTADGIRADLAMTSRDCEFKDTLEEIFELSQTSGLNLDLEDYLVRIVGDDDDDDPQLWATGM